MRKKQALSLIPLILAMALLFSVFSFTAWANAVPEEGVSPSSFAGGVVSGVESIEGLQSIPSSESTPSGASSSETTSSNASTESMLEDGVSSDTDNETNTALPFWVFLAGGILLAAVICAVVLLLMQRRRFKKNSNRQDANGAFYAKAPTTQQPKKKSSQGLLIGNAHHIGGRSSQQDSFCISNIERDSLVKERGVLAVVADGMGGLANGAQISAMVTSVMLRSFEEKSSWGSPSDELLSMVQTANDRVNRYLQEGNKEQSGSTVVAAIIHQQLLYFISVGDSRICLIRNGQVFQINREHNYAADLDEKVARGEISREEAQNDPQRKALTSYIGMGTLLHIDRNLKPFPLLPGDRIVLMSDGVFGTINDAQLESVMRQDAFEAAQELEKRVLQMQKPHQDNFTAVILQCE